MKGCIKCGDPIPEQDEICAYCAYEEDEKRERRVSPQK